MAQDSPNKRKHRRKKLEQRLSAQSNRRQIRGLQERLLNQQFVLLCVLKEADGAYISAETTAEVMRDFTALSWTVERQEDGSSRVILKDSRTVAPVATEAPVGSVTAQLASLAPEEPARTDVEGA